MKIEWEGPVRLIDYLASDADHLRRGTPIARAGIVRETAISVGVAVPISPMLEESCRTRNCPILRRSTGGTGLLHLPGDLLWSLVLPRDDPRVGRGFARSYARYGEPVASALSASGVDARWVPGFGLSDRFCLFGGFGEVLAVHERALGGAAQQLTATGLLHHGTVGAGLDRLAITELFGVRPPQLDERLTGFEEASGSRDLEPVGRAALRSWANDPP